MTSLLCLWRNFASDRSECSRTAGSTQKTLSRKITGIQNWSRFEWFQSFYVVELMCFSWDFHRFSKFMVRFEISLSKIWNFEQWFFHDSPVRGGPDGVWRARSTNQSFFVVELIRFTPGFQRFSNLVVILEISLSEIWNGSKPGFGGRGPKSRSECDRNPAARPGLFSCQIVSERPCPNDFHSENVTS